MVVAPVGAEASPCVPPGIRCTEEEGERSRGLNRPLSGCCASRAVEGGVRLLRGRLIPIAAAVVAAVDEEELATADEVATATAAASAVVAAVGLNSGGDDDPLTTDGDIGWKGGCGCACGWILRGPCA